MNQSTNDDPVARVRAVCEWHAPDSHPDTIDAIEPHYPMWEGYRELFDAFVPDVAAALDAQDAEITRLREELRVAEVARSFMEVATELIDYHRNEANGLRRELRAVGPVTADLTPKGTITISRWFEGRKLTPADIGMVPVPVIGVHAGSLNHEPADREFQRQVNVPDGVTLLWREATR